MKMNKHLKKLTPLIILVFALTTFGQKTVAELSSAHAATLEKFLSENKNYQFLSEEVIDAENFKWNGKWFGKTAFPFYQTADFNHDKITDFAMVLSRKGERQENKRAEVEYHKYNYPLAIVIFNGNQNRTFRQAFLENIEAPYVCYLQVFGEGRKKIYFSVFNSSLETRFFKPSGKTYIVEYPDEP
jgi:hypothetical protein